MTACGSTFTCRARERRSSSPYEPSGMNPYGAIFVPDELTAVLSDRSWFEALLDAERALVAAEAAAGVVSPAAATAVAAALRIELYDCDALARAGRASGTP